MLKVWEIMLGAGGGGDYGNMVFVTSTKKSGFKSREGLLPLSPL